MIELQVVNLGSVDYDICWKLQKKIFNLRLNKEIPDTLLFLEHHHVYTLGKNSEPSHLLANEKELQSLGANVFYIDRGGDITYHGPGQVVGYPILDLNNYYSDIHSYLRDLEEVIIRTLNDFGIRSHREKDYTGVWVGNEKIAAIGIKVSRWVTMHGFALNVNTDLSYFDRIIPCGIFHKGVTSMQKVLGNNVEIDDVIKSICLHFSNVFNVKIKHIDKEEILNLVYEISDKK